MLEPMPIDVLIERGPTFILMSSAQLEAELLQIVEALPPHDVTKPPQNAEEGFALGLAFYDLFEGGSGETPLGLADTLSRLQPSEIGGLAARLQQIHRTGLAGLFDMEDPDYPPTDTYMVNPMWKRRWQTMIEGTMTPIYSPFAYVGTL